MARNVGPEDRVVRIVVALGLCVLIYMGVIGGQIATIIAGVLAAYLLITGLLARCVLYKAIDVDTSVQEQPYSTTDDRAGL
jgi:Na+(H+)/acetate symporter ActP